MLINVAEREEWRIAVVEDDRLDELYIERASTTSRAGNIYKAKVVNVEAGIQAAFLDFGAGKNGFLHISDLHPRYFKGSQADSIENIGRRKALKERTPIQSCLHKKQELVVQVTKEGINTKGPTLSTYISLPGKYLVMMPWMKKLGVSHKIEDDKERQRLRDILQQVNPPKGQGFIIRTAGQGCSKRDIQRDLKYLSRLWSIIEKRITKTSAPAEIYQESNLVIRTLRDVFNSKISKIICDSDVVLRKIRDFLSQAYPRYKQRAVYYDSKIPLFHKYGIEKQISMAQSRTVPLKGGGTIVIEQTEALVAIDVNSGRDHRQKSAEQTAYHTNLEAATEIALQLRLRDLGGLIVCDFIDMRSEKHRRAVEKTFRTATKVDRARSRILKISGFGIVEMTRQRIRPSLQSSISRACPHCGGSGSIKSHETLAFDIMRLVNLAATKEQIKKIEIFVSPEAAAYLQNEKRAAVAQIEDVSDKRIFIYSEPMYTGEKHKLICYNQYGKTIKL